MTQESIVLSTTPPYPGLQMVQDINKALEALGTDFAGTSDPAAFAKPFMVWADTGNMLLKRRNAAGTAWVVLGPLLEELAKKVGDASQRFKAAPSVAVDDVVVRSELNAVSNAVFGIGQTRQNVTASRSFSTTYTNTTGRPIQVIVGAVATATTAALSASIDGSAAGWAWQNTVGGVVYIDFTVLAGETYLVGSQSVNNQTWREVR